MRPRPRFPIFHSLRIPSPRPGLAAAAVALAMEFATEHVYAAGTCADNLTPRTVIIDEFEARNATITDVLEALVLVAEKATRQAYRPNFVVVGDAIGRMKVSIRMRDAPLSEALDQIAALPGVQVFYRENQTVVIALKEG